MNVAEATKNQVVAPLGIGEADTYFQVPRLLREGVPI